MTERESTRLWSTTALTNQTADPNVNWVEGQLPSTVNNSSRAMMAAHARHFKDNNGSITTTGSANAYALTVNATWTAYATGQLISCKASFSNTGAATLNVTNADATALGAKAIRIYNPAGDAALSPYMITSGAHLLLQYDAAANSSAGAWILLNPFPFFYSITDPPTSTTDIGFTTSKKAADLTTTFSSAAVSGIGLAAQVTVQSGATGSFQAVHGAVNTLSAAETYGLIGINAVNHASTGGAGCGVFMREGVSGWTEDTGPAGILCSNETTNSGAPTTGYKLRAGISIAHSAADGSNAFYFGMDVLNPASAIVRGASYLDQGGRNMIRGQYSRGSNQTPAAVHSGDILVGLEGYGCSGGAFSSTGRATVELQANETWSGTAEGTKVIVKATAATTKTTATALTIDSTGITSAANITADVASGYYLGSNTVATVSGNFIVYHDGLANGGEIGIGNGSDQRNLYSNTSHVFMARSFVGTMATLASGSFGINGSSSGVVSINTQAAAGTYNFNLPTGAGTSGQPLLSGGGGSTAMSFGTLGISGGGTGVTGGVVSLISTAVSVDFSSAADNSITIPLPSGYTRIGNIQVIISGASANISAATYGIFTATGGGGTAVTAAGATITVTSASDNTVNNMQIANQTSINTQSITPVANTLYFRVGTTTTGTAKVQIRYYPLP